MKKTLKLRIDEAFQILFGYLNREQAGELGALMDHVATFDEVGRYVPGEYEDLTRILAHFDARPELCCEQGNDWFFKFERHPEGVAPPEEWCAFEALMLLSTTHCLQRIGRCHTCSSWLLKSKTGLRAQRFCTRECRALFRKTNDGFKELERVRQKDIRARDKQAKAHALELARKGIKRGKRR